jgi:phenylpropionate dioxygenase-like ring-hydroxylating dioxygenase large terminal subunit
MTKEWRTVQIFLEPTSFKIYEVELDTASSTNIRCNCSIFVENRTCKHSRYVQNHMKKNNGHYAIQISSSVTDTDVLEAMQNPDTFRYFVIKNAKIEVLH